jgi:hypothetical protein
MHLGGRTGGLAAVVIAELAACRCGCANPLCPCSGLRQTLHSLAHRKADSVYSVAPGFAGA